MRQNSFPQHLDLEDEALAEDTAPPPPYGSQYGEIRDEKNGTGTSAQLTEDGRIAIRINHFSRQLSQILAPALNQHDQVAGDSHPPLYSPPPAAQGSDPPSRPPLTLNIVIQVVGSRGDVQPFVALGKVLKETYGHRVRLATHFTFKEFVQQQGLEFFSIGGDPARLMAFMFKNPGLRPSFRSVMSGDVGQQRRYVAEYIQGCWRSCYRANDSTVEDDGSDMSEGETHSRPEIKPFVADCIIANPPSFAHVHCAEKLGIPLHMMFTMPYSPTQAFPHPLANIQATNTDPRLANYISYALVELLSWQALGDIINRFRVKCLDLDPISVIWAPGMLQRLQIPHTYCWSPALIPKPKDWGAHVSVVGFFSLPTTPGYTPTHDLQAFLDAGPPPIYIGFGSIVLNDPNALTKIIFTAVKQTGQRVLLSKGWGGVGSDELGIPDGVFVLGNVPHDWLFQRVSCVVHHGGAGTTAAGIAAGRPTVVVPFFGDQPFWGAMIAQAGAGPDPIPHTQLTADNLAKAIKFCFTSSCQERALELADKIAAENGCHTGAQSFHQRLDLDRLRCTLAPSRPAVWRLRRTKVTLSAFAAYTLGNAGLLEINDLKLFRAQEYQTDEGPWDPISGGFTAFVRAFSGMTVGLADVPSETVRALKKPVERSRRQSRASVSTATSPTHMSQVPRDSSLSSSSPQAKARRSRKDSVKESVVTLTPASSVLTGSQTGPDAGVQTDMLRPTGVHMTRGAGRFAKAVVQGPVDISVNLVRGFHNMPRLWGDDTIRPQERVGDFKSGMKAVGREFSYGWYDGITGLVTQPWKGAQKEGAGGFFKGVGKGVGGFFAKSSAACVGILGHTMQGVSKEVQKLFKNDVQDYIIASRAAQGYDEWLQASETEKEDIITQWKAIQKTLKKRYVPHEEQPKVCEIPQRQDSIGSTGAWSEDLLRDSLDMDLWSLQEENEATMAHDAAHGTVRSSAENALPPPPFPHSENTETHPSPRDEKTPQEKTEEDIVLEYIKKQSLLELQHRNNSRGTGAERTIVHGGQNGKAEIAHNDDDDDDEDLQRALKLSLQEHERRDS